MNPQINVKGMWFEIVKGKGTVSMISRRNGRYTGTAVNTMTGKQFLFSHHGHRYQGVDPVATFTRMAQREL